MQVKEFMTIESLAHSIYLSTNLYYSKNNPKENKIVYDIKYLFFFDNNFVGKGSDNGNLIPLWLYITVEEIDNKEEFLSWFYDLFINKSLELNRDINKYTVLYIHSLNIFV